MPRKIDPNKMEIIRIFVTIVDYPYIYKKVELYLIYLSESYQDLNIYLIFKFLVNFHLLIMGSYL